MLSLTGVDIAICQICKKGILRRINDLPNKFSNVLFDTSWKSLESRLEVLSKKILRVLEGYPLCWI